MSRRDPASPRRQPKERRELVNEIPDLVSGIMLKHIRVCGEYAKVRIKNGMKEQREFLPQELQDRAECLEQRNWTPTPDMKGLLESPADEALDSDDEPFDPSLAALDSIASQTSLYRSTPAPRKGPATRVPRVTMPPVPSVPKYDAWIPVRTNYWAGKELHVEPYMPFLGDQDDDCELAFEVYEDMAGDAGKELDLSDGEVGSNGKLMLPRDDVERCEYYSMTQARWREGSREAILAVLDKFARFDESMWRVLGSALGMKDIQRVKAIARVAQDRRHEKKGRRSRWKKEREMSLSVAEARMMPKEEEMPVDDEWNASMNPLRLFCFTCHAFPCEQHAGMDVEPVVPIADQAALKRSESLKAKTARPCSKTCFLLSKDDEEDEEWSAQEILLLREAVPMFGIDPCNLAIVIGSRTCCEVSLKLDDPIEKDIANCEIQKARRIHRVEGSKRKPELSLTNNNTKAKISAKTAVEKTSAAATDQDFVPCYHNGPCTAENCSCVKKAMYCESTCGCNFGRYTQSGKVGGVVWTEPEVRETNGGKVVKECQNRHFGCPCEAGNCDSSTCTCYEENRACNADFCACDCSVLPNHISVRKRRCRNLPANIALHKKTFIGKSEVHGFGLFAGEPFEKGDLVGVYSGQLIDTRLADMIGRLYDATDRTYIFNVTESLVIDGGLLGSKAKFCNHTKPGDRENCASKLVRVRGDAYVALFAKRKVEVGEEFLFDYRFTGEIPSWAVDDGARSSRR